MRELGQVVDAITELSTAVREVSHRLHPAPLRCLGVRGALKALEDGFKKTHRIHVNFVVPAEFPRLPDHIEVSIYRIAQECLHNISKHSGADKVDVTLEHTPRRIRLIVKDNGRGFVPSEVIRKGGLGLLSMEERALSIRGRLSVNSTPGVGTEIRLTIPTPEL
jgi:signal transduction histidine kinase